MKIVPIDYSNGLLYWRNCQDSDLIEAITNFMTNGFVFSQSPNQFRLVKSYFHHWMYYPGWEFPEAEVREELIERLNEADDIGKLRGWLISASLYAIDPL